MLCCNPNIFCPKGLDTFNKQMHVSHGLLVLLRLLKMPLTKDLNLIVNCKLKLNLDRKIY